MKKFLEFTDTENSPFLLNADLIQDVVIDEYNDTVIEMSNGDSFTVNETYNEICETLKRSGIKVIR